MHEVEVTQRPARRVIGIGHKGAYNQIGPAFEALGARVSALGLWPEVQEFLGVYFDDPGEVAEADLRSLACIAVREDLALPDGFEQVHLSEGRFAVLRFSGPYDDLADAWGWVYNEWLPASGETSGPGMACEIYLNSPGDVAPEDLRTDICVPLA